MDVHIRQQRVSEYVTFTANNAEGFRGTLVGLLCLRLGIRKWDEHVARIGVGDLQVDDGFQNNGVGTSLVLSMLGWAKRDGVIKRVEVEVPEKGRDDQRLRDFYSRLGFKVEGRKQRAYYHEGYHDSVMMAILLTDPPKTYVLTKHEIATAAHQVPATASSTVLTTIR